MATDTDPRLQNQVIYSVYLRNHTPEGSFRALIGDLPRIRGLGVDWIWLMPIHPIGERDRKGTLGSPYANRDYREVNPEYGSYEDLALLVRAIHEQGMRCMIDVVYNHTSPDSTLFAQHPEFFYRRPDGRPGNRVGDWTDIIDLDYGNAELWDYQVEGLVQWARLVDGFRCDVASFVPVDFWRRARAEVAEVNPDCVWLAETVHRSFGRKMRARGVYCARDTEAFSAFDIEYAYDVQEAFDGYLAGTISLAHYLDLLDFQECTYPAGYNKLRFLENHDLPRIAAQEAHGWDLENLTAFMYFLKGTALLYAGQEVVATHVPSLFDKDVIDWGAGRDLSGLLARLGRIKHDVLGADDVFSGRAAGDVALLARTNADGRKLGVFSLRGKRDEVEVDLADGDYRNLLDERDVTVSDGRLSCDGSPIVLRA